MANLFTVTPHTAIDQIITLEQLHAGNLTANTIQHYAAGKGVNVAKTVNTMPQEKALMSPKQSRP